MNRWSVCKIPTLNGIRFYLTDGERRIPGGFAKKEMAERKAARLNGQAK